MPFCCAPFPPFDVPVDSGAHRAGARCRRGTGRNAQGRGDTCLFACFPAHSYAVQSRRPVVSQLQGHRRWGRGGHCEGARGQQHCDKGLCAASSACVGAVHVARTFIVDLSLPLRPRASCRGEQLFFVNNGIGAAGAAWLACALMVNRTLSVLGLGDNSIGDEGAAALARALATNRSLTRVCLFGHRRPPMGGSEC